MFTPLVRDSYVPPERLVTPLFVCRKLCFADAEIDYRAVMSSIEVIQKTRGGDWPTPDLSLEDNRIDLAWHQREFENKSSFAFIVLTPDEKTSLGCFYFYQPGFRDADSRKGDVDVSFWVTQEAYDAGLYEVLYKTIREWLESSWPFSQPIYTNVMLPD